MKTSYISPAVGELEITIIRDAVPSVTIALDLGIPNFTRFALKFPLVVDEPKNMTVVTQEALGVLLDEVATFMLSLKFDKDVITDVYARALSCFAGMGTASSTQAEYPETAQDNHIQTFEGTFQLPQTFVQEIQERVVTGASVVRRLPAVRQLELTPMIPNKTNIGDAQRVIKMYRNRQLKTQPKPLYVIVYDQVGRPSGVLPVQQQWKSRLLQKIQASDKTAAVTIWHRGNDIESSGEYNNFTTEASMLEHTPQDQKCPKCGGPLPKFMPVRDRENEVTHSTGRCRCGANLIVFND